MQLDEQTARSVSTALMRICQRSPFLATLALHARIEATAELPTAATDGRDVFINPEFYGKLTPAEQEGLLLHEVLHAALLHVDRRGGRDAKLWNVAADIVVNGIVAKEGYQLPEGGLRDQHLEHLSTEEVYDLVQQQQQANQHQAQAAESDLLDVRPTDASKPAEERPGQNDKTARDAYWRKALEQAGMIAEGGRQPGTLPGGIQRELRRLAPAQLDWRSYLWRFLVRTPTDFSNFDRRFVGRGLYLETLDSDSVRAYVAVDTSGSINEHAVSQFLAEVQSILFAYPHIRCDLYFADTELYGPYPLTAQSELPTPIGGGGTDFRPFLRRVAGERDENGATLAIYLTDGYGAFPKETPDMAVLWVVTPGGLDEEKFPFGEVVALV
ncbi:MAG: VWA-like domain-containing protein [Chloroflexaceae bacterium]|jgi:predicted metal-dependent peptidase|nr:VWA-like domain-containing protein [Chloroflexaceae bacterium]